MLRLDVRRSELAGLVAREEYHPPGLLCVSFEHVPPLKALKTSAGPQAFSPLPPCTSITIFWSGWMESVSAFFYRLLKPASHWARGMSHPVSAKLTQSASLFIEANTLIASHSC